MNPLKQGLLSLYCALTHSQRKALLAQMIDQRKAPISVLFYHRVADTDPNDWTLSTGMFKRQLDWLTERFEFISLSEAQKRLSSGISRRPAVVITFDDGYADNCEFAIPHLLKRNIPFTYFVTTEIIEEQSAFPHDLAAGKVLKPNSIAEIRAMADAGVEVGAHTRTHPDLGASIDPKWLESEIAGSKQDLESWIGRQVRYFAFPFGLKQNTSPEAFAAVAAAGFEGVCTAYGAYNLPGAPSIGPGAFHVRRIHADPEWSRFKNWMTFDPRKLQAADPILDRVTLCDAKQEPELQAMEG